MLKHVIIILRIFNEIFLFFIFYSPSLLAVNFNDSDIFFINGINTLINEEDNATAAKAVVQGREVKFLYNFSKNLLNDAAETWQLNNVDGHPSDFVKEWLDGNITHEIFRKSSVYWKTNSARDDINRFVSNIKIHMGKSGNSKAIIIGYSEGTLLANLVTKKLISDNPDMKSCVGVNLVGTVTSNVENSFINNENSSYTASSYDLILYAFRPFVANTLLKSNVAPTANQTSNFDEILAFNIGSGDPKGHGFRQTYIKSNFIKPTVQNGLVKTKQNLDKHCNAPPPVVACGGELDRSGGQTLGDGITYTIDLGTNSGKVKWGFEAFTIPDQYSIKLNGNSVAKSSGFVKGYHAGEFNVPASSGGNIAVFSIKAPDPSTGWRALLSCPGGGLNTKEIQCSASVKHSFLTASPLPENCKIRTFLNGKQIANAWGAYQNFKKVVSNFNREQSIEYSIDQCLPETSSYRWVDAPICTVNGRSVPVGKTARSNLYYFNY